VQRLEPSDIHRLNAALGWLGLSNPAEARAELDASAEMAAAPDDCSGWLHRAYALRRAAGGGLPQAREALLPAAEKFPREPVVAYNLACYACQLLQLDEAREWFGQAVKVGGAEAVKKMALADDDLKPLWPEIERL